MIESYKITNNKGRYIILNDHYLAVSSFGSLGSSNIEYQTYSGYLQDGGNVSGYRLDDKQLNLTLSSIEFKDRQTYVSERETLYRFFSPVCSPFTFEITYINGSKRTLNNLYLQSILPNNYQTNIFVINDSFSFLAKQPYWLGETRTLAVTESIDEFLIFPITFPIQFGTSGKRYKTNHIYNGSYKAYPKITLSGQYTNAVITLINKNVSIYMDRSISPTETRVINLSPTNRYVVDSNGVNKASDLGLNSNLSNFYAEPYDTLQIEATFYGYSVGTSMQVEMQEAYIGL